MEIPTSVVASELWLRDDLEEVYALLFRFLGFGFRLAMSNVGWLVTQKFVILVPDPIAFAPRQIQELDESFTAGPALQLSLFQDTSDWPPLVLCAEPQTSREVDQDREVRTARARHWQIL